MCIRDRFGDFLAGQTTDSDNSAGPSFPRLRDGNEYYSSDAVYRLGGTTNLNWPAGVTATIDEDGSINVNSNDGTKAAVTDYVTISVPVVATLEDGIEVNGSAKFVIVPVYHTKYVVDETGTLENGVKGNRIQEGRDAGLDYVYDDEGNLAGVEKTNPKQDELIPVGIKDAVSIEKIPFDTIYRNNDDLEYGQEQTVQEGVEGEKTTTTTRQKADDFETTGNVIDGETTTTITKEKQD